jgi:hypothetical protein
MGRGKTMNRVKLFASFLVAIVMVASLMAAPAVGSAAQGGTELWTSRYHPAGSDFAVSMAARAGFDYATIAYEA